jgi:Mg2+ and Co2+ transporter CorA
MTPIESIYEIRSAVLDLQRYLQSKDKVIFHRAQERYKKWVDRFFKKNVNVIETEKRNICLHDVDYFLKLLESTVEYYDNQNIIGDNN